MSWSLPLLTWGSFVYLFTTISEYPYLSRFWTGPINSCDWPIGHSISTVVTTTTEFKIQSSMFPEHGLIIYYTTVTWAQTIIIIIEYLSSLLSLIYSSDSASSLLLGSWYQSRPQRLSAAIFDVLGNTWSIVPVIYHGKSYWYAWMLLQHRLGGFRGDWTVIVGTQSVSSFAVYWGSVGFVIELSCWYMFNWCWVCVYTLESFSESPTWRVLLSLSGEIWNSPGSINDHHRWLTKSLIWCSEFATEGGRQRKTTRKRSIDNTTPQVSRS